MISPASLPRIAFSLLSSVSPSFHQTSDPVSALFSFIVSFVVLRLPPAINSFMYYAFGEERERELHPLCRHVTHDLLPSSMYVWEVRGKEWVLLYEIWYSNVRVLPVHSILVTLMQLPKAEVRRYTPVGCRMSSLQRQPKLTPSVSTGPKSLTCGIIYC